MTSNLDSLLVALRDHPLDPRLETLEAQVWSRIATRAREPAATSIWGWRAALTALMVSVGLLTAGGVAAGAASETSPFAIHSAFAPSTVLGDQR